ncbi:MAG TPA: heavy metal translocating P-type ATPase [Burkholderiales bacterium]
MTTAAVLAGGALPASRADCFHCGLPVPEDATYAIEWEGERRPLCCRGCEAVAEAIVRAGLGEYYRRRTEAPPSPRARAEIPEELRIYDHPELQRRFVRTDGDRREATLILEGVTCPACVWLNEQTLRRLPGVQAVRANYATQRAQVVWDAARLRLSDILEAVRALGYRAHPYDPARHQELLARERRALLKRLGVAGIAAAQTMTLAVALYVGDWSGSDPALRTFFHWISLLFALPVLGYAAQPFFRGAWADLRRRQLGMDVPIALGMSLAFGASLWNTVTGDGTVYYDSVAMFALFLLAGRYFELSARARAAQAAEALVQATPAAAHRLRPDAAPEQVPVAELEPGDEVLVRPGETVPADGMVIDGRSSVSEAVLTGESLPIAKGPGAAVIGGSINVESPLTVRVERVGVDTVLSSVLRLLDRAQSEKSRLAELADRIGPWFVALMLAAAALVGLYWWQTDPARVLPVVVAVLVVTCPCALGLATPTALAAATGALMRLGVLATRGHALETLARATHFVFDKTGTVTRGELRLAHVEPLADVPAERCLALAAALERYSEHPLARAVCAVAGEMPLPEAANVQNVPGEGLRGLIDGTELWLGTAPFVQREARIRDAAAPEPSRATTALLATRGKLLARLHFEDALRPGAAALVAELQAHGRHAVLLSGDQPHPVAAVAEALGVPEARAAQTPADKLKHLRQLQSSGAIVAMVGDGINDAPVLAAAQVSIAMGGGAQLAAASADMVLLASDMRRLRDAWRLARRTVAVVRQNFAWAIAYNVLAVPAAAAGLVTPWAAALGMSLSSAIVVANALRLARAERSDASPGTG